MAMNRREFTKAALAAGLLGAAGQVSATTSTTSSGLIKPPRLRAGDTIGLVNPSAAAFHPEWVDIFKEELALLGLRPRLGPHFFDRRGYLAGTDEDRAADINTFFRDPSIHAIIAWGGWGAARILSRINYDAIRRNPKIFMGYSDITSLLLAIHQRTGLVTFHGPYELTPFALSHIRRVLFDAKAIALRNPKGDGPVQIENRVRTITPGRARGRILGGNLTVLTTIMGSDYLPSWKGSILFLEDKGEQIYRVDRMFTQLKLAGVLDQISGFVLGRCTDCNPGEGYGSLTLDEVLQDHIAPLAVPAWQGAMIGHIDDQYTIPLGIEVEIDADAGIIQMLEPAVT
jgi:muramoyltetrapeptide carboxypeptidase